MSESIEHVQKLRKLEMAFFDLEEAWNYTEILLKGRYHEADPFSWHPRGRPPEDHHMREALVTALVISLSRAQKYWEECLETQEEKDFARMVRLFRDKYFAHSDILPYELGFIRPAWDEGHTRQARSLIEKTFRHLKNSNDIVRTRITPEMTNVTEYRVENITFDEMFKRLNELGQEGWELWEPFGERKRILDEVKREWFYRVGFKRMR